MSSEEKTISAVNANEGLKNFIIGKVWANAQDGVRAGTIKLNRSLPCKIELTAGQTLFLQANTKRDGKQDADYSVSILLPTAIADEMIKEQAAREAGLKEVAVA